MDCSKEDRQNTKYEYELKFINYNKKRPVVKDVPKNVADAKQGITTDDVLIDETVNELETINEPEPTIGTNSSVVSVVEVPNMEPRLVYAELRFSEIEREIYRIESRRWATVLVFLVLFIFILIVMPIVLSY